MFGLAAEGDGGRGRKRRAWFGLGVRPDPEVPVQRTGPGVLANPKAKSLGLSLRQRAARGNRLPQQGKGAEPMAACASVPAAKATRAPEVTTAEARRPALDSLARPELAGVKLWPASGRPLPRAREIPLPAPPALHPPGADIGKGAGPPRRAARGHDLHHAPDRSQPPPGGTWRAALGAQLRRPPGLRRARQPPAPAPPPGARQALRLRRGRDRRRRPDGRRPPARPPTFPAASPRLWKRSIRGPAAWPPRRSCAPCCAPPTPCRTGPTTCATWTSTRGPDS
jgi:hypothetical protein